MKNFITFFKNSNLTAPAIIIAIAMILVGLILRNSANTFANKTDSITVTGSAERIVKSDTVKWIITVNGRAMGNNATPEVNNQLKNNIAKVLEYLNKNNIKESTEKGVSITLNQPNMSNICSLSPQGYENCAMGITGQTGSQTIIVESGEVDAITKLSLQINNNLTVTQALEYYYNNLKNIRAEMLNEATKNAKERADSVASAGGANIGSITSLSSGVFQVTAKNSVEYDGGGSYDTSSVEKKIVATVKANFSVK